MPFPLSYFSSSPPRFSLPFSHAKKIDFIGDIHGHARALTGLLSRLGYRRKSGVFRKGKVGTVFLGDLLNRGPEVPAVAKIVRDMVDCGQAVFLLGNHELFALWDDAARRYGAAGPVGKKAGAHLAESRAAFEKAGVSWEEFVAWLWRCPLVFEAPGVRGVHACWDERAVCALPDNRVRPGDFLRPGGRRLMAVWQLVEGPSLVEPRTGENFRIRWWENAPTTWQGAAYVARYSGAHGRLPRPRLSQFPGYPPDAPPVFFGHYGFKKALRPVRANLACLDLAVASGGAIAAYRWKGENILTRQNFFSAGQDPAR